MNHELFKVEFYKEHFGFQLIHRYDFAEWGFSLYFLAILPEGEVAPSGSPKDSEEYLWNFKGLTLELTHNYGTESDESFAVNNGNVEPFRGFGHIAVMTRDVYAASAELEMKGVRFQKKPDEGRMKGLAFALDPDGYWVEIVKRDDASPVLNKFTLAQTMMRVKDPEKSLRFYRDLLGMSLLRQSDHGVGSPGGFSLFFLASNIPAESDMKMIFEPVLELTHNHGTESNPDFNYHNGNDQDKGQLRGFGHIGFLVDDLDAACKMLEDNGVSFKKKPSEGKIALI